ncbi:MAG: hypothetical protein IT204_16890 [Fimbriimonadaceae bacterium]|nr:hypothetical protein [Fimbriimonadaceae bacterium]
MLACALLGAVCALAAEPVPAAWLPETIGGARRIAGVSIYDPVTVFDYMDGKAEIYLTYAFRRLVVAPYQVGEQQVQVHLFDMTTAAEAFGIDSNLLAGEAVPGLQAARYQDGVLRGWQGQVFLKVEAEGDQPAVRQFAVAAAQHLATCLPAGEPFPPLAAALPREPLKLRELQYFHQQSNLDALFYISTENVLGLGPETSALLAAGELAARPLRVLLVEYPSEALRDQALTAYRAKVLSEKATARGAAGTFEELDPGFWSGVRPIRGPAGQPRLGLALEASTLQACQEALALLATSAAAG